MNDATARTCGRSKQWLLWGVGAVVLAAIAVEALAANHCGDALFYKQPATTWASEALPLGNGRMGCMMFGGVAMERIQFNEQSLWSGDNNWDGDYECGDHGFGSYRNFGEIC